MRARSLLLRLSSRLHPQLPLTAHESKKLIDVLNTQFHKELDKKHPLPHVLGSNGVSEASLKDGTISSPYTSAAQHLDRILNNPLLAGPRKRSRSPSGSVALSPVDQASLQDNATAWFTSKVATGTAGVHSAKAFLAFSLRAVRDESRDAKQILLKERQAARHVLGCMHSGNAELVQGWIKDRQFRQMLISCLVAEGYDHTIVKSLRELAANHMKLNGIDTAAEVTTFQGVILSSFISSHIYFGRNLNDITKWFLQCLDDYSSASTGVVPVAFYSRAATRLASCIIHLSHRHGISSQHYTQLQLLIPSFESNAMINSAIALYHPTDSDCKPFLGLLEQIEDGAVLEIKAGEHQRGSEETGQIPLSICLDAADALISKGKHTEAARLLAIIKSKANPLTSITSEFSFNEKQRYASYFGSLSFG